MSHPELWNSDEDDWDDSPGYQANPDDIDWDAPDAGPYTAVPLIPGSNVTVPDKAYLRGQDGTGPLLPARMAEDLAGMLNWWLERKGD